MSQLPPRSSAASGFVLVTASCALLGAALLVWEARAKVTLPVENTISSTRLASGKAHNNQAAMQLLRRSYKADNDLSYEADVHTTAMYGARKMQTNAHLTRAPRRLSVTYLSGARCGLQGGYNEHWFWRRDGKGAPLQAYAEVAYRPEEMAAQRFVWLTQNYDATVLRTEKIAKRVCDLVEVRRKKTLDGTKGPFKRLWLDRETALTLRTDSFNYRGDLVQRSLMTDLKIRSVSTNKNFVAPDAMKAVAKKAAWNTEETGADIEKVARMSGFRPPQPRWLPQGFAFDSVGMQRTSLSKGAPLAALSRYSDGLNVITIFVFKNSKSTKPSPEEISCTFGAGTMAMQPKPNGLSVLAVADLPASTLQHILDKVVLAPTAASVAKTPAPKS